MKDKILAVRRLREGGNVKRCHALVHNDHGYTDGKHSFDAACMLLVLHPNPSMNLLKFMLWHDTGERWVGDLPASAKWASSDLANCYEELEIKVWQSHLPMVHEAWTALTIEDRHWIRAIDGLEFAFWCQDQLSIGNLHIGEAWKNIMEGLAKLRDSGQMPEEVRDFIDNGGLEWERLPERFDR